MINKKVMPPTWMLISILVMIVLDVLLPGIKIIPPLWGLIGFVPLAVGVVISLIADQAFRRANTIVKPFEESSALVTNGVYSFSRNPMYLGFTLALIGLGIFMRSLTPFVIIAAFIIVIDRMYIKEEEEMLREKFGERWFDFKQRTRRWL